LSSTRGRQDELVIRALAQGRYARAQRYLSSLLSVTIATSCISRIGAVNAARIMRGIAGEGRPRSRPPPSLRSSTLENPAGGDCPGHRPLNQHVAGVVLETMMAAARSAWAEAAMVRSRSQPNIILTGAPRSIPNSAMRTVATAIVFRKNLHSAERRQSCRSVLRPRRCQLLPFRT